MYLNVPLIRQPTNTSDCGIASIAMIFEYYKVPKTFDDIKKELKNRRYGIHVPELGNYLLENGFDVELITINPRLFTAKDEGTPERKVRKLLIRRRFRSKLNRSILGHYKYFLKLGGKISVKVMDMNDIKNEIKDKRPLIGLVLANFLNADKPSFNLHFNVITGCNKESVFANDPLRDKRGGEKEYKKEHFFYSMFATVGRDIDTATLMKIRKK